MSDFTFMVDVLRGRVADELVDVPEQAMWVFAEVASSTTADRFADFTDTGHDAATVAAFLRELADLIEQGDQS